MRKKRVGLVLLYLLLIVFLLYLIGNSTNITGRTVLQISRGQTFNVNLPYDKSWEFEAKGSIIPGGKGDRVIVADEPSSIDWFWCPPGQYCFRLANGYIFFTNNYDGINVNNPYPSSDEKDHVAGIGPIAAYDGGYHEFKIRYIFTGEDTAYGHPKGTMLAYEDGNLLGSYEFVVTNTRGPTTVLKSERFSGTFSYGLLCESGDKINENSPCIVQGIQGMCKFGTKYQECDTSTGDYVWSSCTPSSAKSERCDGLDNDCDGLIDEGCDDDQDGYVDGTMRCGVLPYIFSFGWSAALPAPGDYDGDGIEDVAAFCPANCNASGAYGLWYIQQSRDGMKYEQFGFPGSLPAPGDYDGDGKTDLAVYCDVNCPNDVNGIDHGIWYILQSKDGMRFEAFGYAGTLPAPGDYDGDGRTDLSVYDPEIGKIYTKRTQQGLVEDSYGFPKCVPSFADYDGDGITDYSVYYGPWFADTGQFGNWFILGEQASSFGGQGYTPVPFDYDNDGKANKALYKEGIWYVIVENWAHIVQCRDEQGNKNSICKGCNELDLDDTREVINTQWPCTSDADCVDDNNPCTTEQCVDNVCIRTNNSNTCDDGLFCTINDMCNKGICNGNVRICPDDNIGCTIPTCDESQDKCMFSYEECTCDNDDDCPDDENICTDDKCVSNLCQAVPNSNQCNDNDACTTGDSCIDGSCLGIPVNIDDNDATTYDACVNGEIIHEPFETGRVYDFQYEYDTEYGIDTGEVSTGNQTNQTTADSREGEKGSSVWIWIIIIVIILLGVIGFIAMKKPEVFEKIFRKKQKPIQQPISRPRFRR